MSDDKIIKLATALADTFIKNVDMVDFRIDLIGFVAAVIEEERSLKPVDKDSNKGD